MTRNEAKLILLRSRIQDVNDEDFDQAFDMAIQVLSIPEHNYENCHNITCRRKSEKDGYDKAIDDFVKKISESNQGHWRVTRYKHSEAVSETMSYDIGTIKWIAEQLKGGE